MPTKRTPGSLKRAELANRSGCNIETIRYYEKIGMLPDPPRTASGYRLYDEKQLARLRFILRARELGFPIEIGEMELTECNMINQFQGSKSVPPQFSRGYGVSLGHGERKAMAMALVDRALRADEFSEAREAPAQDEEFVLSHCDNVQATGFVEHLKLPHYVDFQSELELVRRMRREIAENANTAPVQGEAAE